MFIFSISILLLFFIPESVYAWGPATHLHYGTFILDSLHLIQPSVAALLQSHSEVYLYGNVSADIVLAKKFGRALEHGHLWENGLKLLDHAKSDRQQTFALGYLSHLAADCISHNCYVPSKSIESVGSGIFKHVYWELRFDKRVTNEGTLKQFEKIIAQDYSDCDALFENIIPMRLLNFSFNKRVFNKVIKLQGLERWQKLLSSLDQHPELELSEATVADYSQRSIDAIRDFLNNKDQADIVNFDPKGDERQGAVKKLKKDLKLLSLQEQRAHAKKHAERLHVLPEVN